MRSASPELIEHLNTSRSFLMADLYTITLEDGTTLRWTSCDRDIATDGGLFKCSSNADVPIVTRGKTRIVAGLEVDQLDVILGTAKSCTLGGIPMVLAALHGAFDAARLRLERAWLVSPEDPTVIGSLVMFEGAVAGVDPASMQMKLVVKSELERLNVQLPMYLYGPACSHAVFDPGCGLARASFEQTGTVQAGSTVLVVKTDRTDADGWYDLGVIAFSDGPAAGSRRAVKGYLHSDGAFTMAFPLPAAPAAGNTFVASPGCKRDAATCAAKFSNLAHFRGFPYAPPPELMR